MINERKEINHQKAVAKILLNVCPADLLHGTKLHAHGLQGVAPTFPLVPLHSTCTISAHSSPAINTIRVCMVTVVVPKCPQVCLGTATGRPILIFVKGGELYSVVVSQTIPCRNTTQHKQSFNVVWTCFTQASCTAWQNKEQPEDWCYLYTVTGNRWDKNIWEQWGNKWGMGQEVKLTCINHLSFT